MKNSILKVQDSNLSKGEQIVNMLEKFDLLWNVVKTPLFVPHKVDDTTEYVHTDYFATQREDTGKIFTTIKKGYQILQNWELCELLQEVAGSFDLEVAKGGSFQDGAKIFLQISTGKLKGIGENNDTIKKWITALNSHDGTSALAYGKTNVTISCSNTFHAANKSLNSKIRHTMSMKDKLEILRNELSAVREQEQTLYQKFFEMANREATTQNIKNVVQTITNVDLNVGPIEAENIYTTQQLNKTKSLSVRIAEEMATKGETLWGLFSGVTKYTNNDIATPKRDNGIMESKFIGGANKIDNKIFELLTADMV
jgi:phage/plasmid-like protein (TIGR03299 family)